MSFRNKLLDYGPDHDEACSDALEWLGDRTEAEAWRDCPRADWMLWCAERRPDLFDRVWLVRAGTICARTALPYAGKNRAICEAACDAYDAWCADPTPENEARAARAARTAGAAARASAWTTEAAWAAAVAAEAAEAAWEAEALAAAEASAWAAWVSEESSWTVWSAARAAEAAGKSLSLTALTSEAALAAQQIMADLIRPLWIPEGAK